MEDYKYLFKVVLVGNSGVGKTCLVRKFTQVIFIKLFYFILFKGIFPPGQKTTIGVDFMIKTVKVDEDKIKLQIWVNFFFFIVLLLIFIGYCRPGTFSFDYAKLLSFSSCNCFSL